MGDGSPLVHGSIYIVDWRGLRSGRVPMDSEVMVWGSMKLWVAPQLSSASILVVLCHMFTVKGIVIEFLSLLYMWATIAGGLTTFKLWQTKNPLPYHGHQGIHFFLHLPWLLLGLNLLCTG